MSTDSELLRRALESGGPVTHMREELIGLLRERDALLKACASLVYDADHDHSSDPDSAHRHVTVKAVEAARVVILKAMKAGGFKRTPKGKTP